ncbi:MAG: alpha/beta fold hydrolase [Phycisphaerae bacterium]
MKRTSLVGSLALIPAAIVGCASHTEQEARLLVVPVQWVGKTTEYCAGPRERLLKNGRIDAHHRVKTADGVEIDVWVIKSRLRDEAANNEGSIFEGKITRGTVVMLHPLLAGKTWFLGMGQKLADRGWDVVLMDLRGHGYSGGQYTTWGVKEKRDVKAVVDELVKAEPISDRIYACGSSTGGSVAIQYAATDPRCKGVIAVAPPAGAIDIFRRVLCLLPEPRFEAALKQAGQMADFDPAGASAVAAAGELSCPLILIHGSWDFLVPFRHSQQIADAASGPKKLISLKCVGHASEIGRTGWLTDQIDVLADMQRSEEPSVRTITRARWRQNLRPWSPGMAGPSGGVGYAAGPAAR